MKSLQLRTDHTSLRLQFDSYLRRACIGMRVQSRIDSSVGRLLVISKSYMSEYFQIPERKRKLYLVAADSTTSRHRDVTSPTAIVSKKYGTITFGRAALTAMGANGSFIKFYYDSDRNVVAWRFTSRLDGADLKDKTWKMVKPTSTNGTVILGIKRILNQFKGLSKDSYPGLTIKKYTENQSLIEGGMYYFVSLDEKETDDDKENV